MDSAKCCMNEVSFFSPFAKSSNPIAAIVPCLKFSSGSFGSASFVRRGDGKQGYLAGLQ